MFQSIFRRVAGFTLSQATKTIRRPSRVFFIPLLYFILTFSHSPRVMLFVARILPDSWLGRLGGKTLCFQIGYGLFQRDRPAVAWPWLQRGLGLGAPSTGDNLLAAMCLYHGLGHFREAMALLARANNLGLVKAKKLGLGNVPFRVLDSIWARHIGHLATLDYVIKLGILEGRHREDTILYLPPGSPVANRFLLQQMAEHLRLVERSADLPFDASFVQALQYDYLGPRLPDGTTAYFWEIAAKTYERWHQEGRGPLLTLPPEIEGRGWAVLNARGVPQGAWFVALHVREGKWDGYNAGLHGVMNADISTYFPAIAEITRRGGWVVRMGDPGMTRLPSLPNVIDYCHSESRADWMDVFIAARCRFMVGTSSGPAFIPPLYGRPLVLTNWWPPAQRPWHRSDIFIPKMFRRLAGGRYLTLSETLSEPFSYCHSRNYLASHEHVWVEECDPLMIGGAVREMLARLEGEAGYGAEVSHLRARADRIYQAHGVFGAGQLATDFLQRHDSLIV